MAVGAMNSIQKISLKLQLGIDPSSEVQPVLLRAMWRKDHDEKYGSGWIARRKQAAGRQAESPSEIHRLR